MYIRHTGRLFLDVGKNIARRTASEGNCMARGRDEITFFQSQSIRESDSFILNNVDTPKHYIS